MKVEQVSLQNPSLQSIELSRKILIDDGIIVYPTDTAYGIGVNAMSDVAIEKLYDLKGRDHKKPTHVVVRNWEMIEMISKPNETAYKLYEEFLPGPLTLILEKDPSVISDKLTGGLPTIGVRIPDTEFTKQLSNFLPFPYTTPSANRSGELTPYSIDDVKNVLDVEKVDLIIDAGELQRELPSTIVDCTNQEIKILREGPIALKEIKQFV